MIDQRSDTVTQPAEAMLGAMQSATIVDPAIMETNLVRVSVRARGGKAAEWSAALKQRGVLVSPARAAWELRFVTHRHIGNAEIDCTLGVFAETCKQFEAAGGTGPGADKNSKAAYAEPAQCRS